MKKRLLVYLSVMIGCLFIGLTTYYLVKSYEFISVTASSGNEIYLNLQETETLSIIHNHPAENSSLSATISDEKIISFDVETGTITALTGGDVTLTINSTNENFGPFTFSIKVGDGLNTSTPFYIKTANDLKSIGKSRVYNDSISQNWGLDCYYKLINGIDLKDIEWSAIGSFDNEFTGQFYGDNNSIDNLTITGTSECAGLFAHLSNLAIVDSVKFNNTSITGLFDYCGIVSAVSSGATISRIEITNATILTAPRIFEDENKIKALSMTGGIVGYCNVEYWPESGSEKSDYAYTRSNITMCSFEGTIGTTTLSMATAYTADEIYMAFGGIVGYEEGSTVLNNKAEVTFSIPSGLAVLSNLSKDVKDDDVIIMVGGIIGLIDVTKIKENKADKDSPVIDTIYPFVKNNLAIMSCNNITDKTNGVIGKVPVYVQLETGKQEIVGNYYYTETAGITFGGSLMDNSTTQITNLSSLKEKNTYITSSLENWDIGDSISVWTIDEGTSAPKINLNGIKQDVKFLDEAPYTISNATEFKYYYDKMTITATNSAGILSKKFWLSQSYILEADINLSEAGITEWIPIGYDYTFMGTFDGNDHKIFFDGEEISTINFVNTKNEDDSYAYKYGAIFGVLNTTSEVKNLTIEGFNVNYAEFAGGIAGINNGTITNCYVKDIKIENAICVGFMVGFNNGVIQNTVESEEIIYSITTSLGNRISILKSLNTVYAGGITGFNEGSISNIKISGIFTIGGETTEEDIIRVLGGAVGYNKGNITSCSVEKGSLSDNSKVRISIGGFCGINDGVISSSHTGMEEGGEFTTITTDINKGNQSAGGFVAYLGYNGLIEKCFANVSVTGYYAAGLASDLLGTASECYVKGSVTGEFIGGFACNLAFKSDNLKGGKISNSYNTVTLTGITDNSISAGLVLFIRTPGTVEYCFISNTFTGLGEKFYESYTDTRFKPTQFATSKISPSNTLGTIKGIVINTNYSYVKDEVIIEAKNPEVKTNAKYFNDKSQTVFYVNKSDCLLGKDVYELAGFSVGSTAYWAIEEGYFPVLTNLALDQISQIVEENDTPESPQGDPGVES